MTNGAIDATQVEAILSGGQPSVNRYMVTTLQQLIVSVEDNPDAIARAVRAHQRDCRGQSRKQLVAIASAIGAIIGLATPYLLHLL